MFPFWDLVIAPALQAAQARRIVEIGALRGQTTVRLLNLLGPETELHVIDPAPGFDPLKHERRCRGRYAFYRAISHQVLPHLPAMDAVLIDGDHNWYTVYHELRMLAVTAAAANRPLPLLIIHDVRWPYGRRDLYYAPARIPARFRQPYARRGMRPGRAELLASGGLNRTLLNACTEGGPRNGVMTALEDFLAGYAPAVRQVVLPLYFGLAVVADERRLVGRPELAARLDWLESAEGRGQLLELGESLRLRRC